MQFISIDFTVLFGYTLKYLQPYGHMIGVINMPFSYKPLWKLLIDQEMSKKQLMELTGISKSTVMKMNKGENVSMDVIERICMKLHCDVSDIVSFLEE